VSGPDFQDFVAHLSVSVSPADSHTHQHILFMKKSTQTPGTKKSNETQQKQGVFPVAWSLQ
jgi:hypothetical protein